MKAVPFVFVCVCVMQLTVEPYSSYQLGVRFSPSSIGEGRHTAKITFTCPEVDIHTKHTPKLRGNGLHKSPSPAFTYTQEHIQTHIQRVQE